MAKKQKNNVKLVAGIALVILILVAVLLATPGQQFGLFRLPSSRELFRTALERRLPVLPPAIPDCTSLDYSIRNGYNGGNISITDPARNIKSLLSSFSVIPTRTCNLRSITMKWQSASWDREVLHINLLNTSVQISVPTRNDIPRVESYPNNNNICMATATEDFATLHFRFRDAIAITPATTASVEFYGLIYVSANRNAPQRSVSNSYYHPSIFKINNEIFRTPQSLPELTISHNTRVNQGFEDAYCGYTF